MTAIDEQAVLHVPAREIPVPTTISPEAQAVLAPHGFFRGATPEDAELDREVRRCIDLYCR